MFSDKTYASYHVLKDAWRHHFLLTLLIVYCSQWGPETAWNPVFFLDRYQKLGGITWRESTICFELPKLYVHFMKLLPKETPSAWCQEWCHDESRACCEGPAVFESPGWCQSQIPIHRWLILTHHAGSHLLGPKSDTLDIRWLFLAALRCFEIFLVTQWDPWETLQDIAAAIWCWMHLNANGFSCHFSLEP